MLWLWNKWKPHLIFSKKSFNELFGFGSKLLISGLIDTLYKNLYYLIIGKYFSAQELGFYTRADQFKNLPSQNLTSVVTRVSYPVLAQLQEDTSKLKAAYKKLIKGIMLISFVLMIGMAAVANSMVLALVGAKWQPSIIYLEMLCFVGMFYPLHALNLSVLQVKGRSDLFLKIEIIKKILAVPTIIVGIFFGIKIMIIGMMFNTLISYFLNSYWSGRFINYPIKEQINDILPSFFVALSMGIAVYFLGQILVMNDSFILMFQIFAGAAIAVSLCKIFNIEAYYDLREIIVSQLNIFKNGKKQ